LRPQIQDCTASYDLQLVVRGKRPLSIRNDYPSRVVVINDSHFGTKNYYVNYDEMNDCFIIFNIRNEFCVVF
jgi:hypothetical protein